MFIKGVQDYNRSGEACSTGLIITKVTRDGEMRETSRKNAVGCVSCIAYRRQDGSAAFINVKAFGDDAEALANAKKGDTLIAAGRIETREYSARTYVDLITDFFTVITPEAKKAEQMKNFTQLTEAIDSFNAVLSEEEDQGELPF